MGTVTIQDYTVLHPLAMIGEEAGVCWNADTSSLNKNIERGKKCLKNGHFRTSEFPDIYMIIDGYSARVIREFYTHIGGAPTRLQASTRYIDYEHGFDYIIPYRIAHVPEAKEIYLQTMDTIANNLRKLDDLKIPKEDSANMLPLGMTTKIVCKMNFRTLMTMSHQRKCSRAYWEFRQLFADIEEALCEYSAEWKYLVDCYCVPKCNLYGFCPESDSCNLYPQVSFDALSTRQSREVINEY